jgi:hypothetical protein
MYARAQSSAAGCRDCRGGSICVSIRAFVLVKARKNGSPCCGSGCGGGVMPAFSKVGGGGGSTDI